MARLTNFTKRMTEPLAFLSIVSHGHGPLLNKLLIDLDNQTVAGYLEVLVTRNIKDEEIDIDAFPNLHVTVIDNVHPKGFGANHNSAFALCRSPWFFIVNPDIRIPQRDAIERMLEAAREQPNWGLLSPRVSNSSGEEEDFIRDNLTFPSLLKRHLLRSGDSVVARNKKASFFWLAGMFLLARSEDFRGIGGFDERYFLYCEDYDLCARMRIAGRQIGIDWSNAVIHDAQRDSRRSWKHQKLHINSLVKVWLSVAFWRISFGLF